MSEGQSQITEGSDPRTCSRNNEGVYINRAPCKCAKMITLPVRLLGVRRLLRFVMAWRSTSDLFVLTTIIVGVCMVLGEAINHCKASKVVLIISCSF